MAGGDVLTLAGEIIGSGAVGTIPTSVQDFGNEQTVPLAANATFTGQWRYCAWSPTILSFYIAEYASNPVITQPTFTIQWSADGVNPAPSVFGSSAQTVSFFSPSSSLPNGAFIVFNYTSNILWPYYRIVIQNGDQPQSTVFALQLLYGQQFPGSFTSLVGNTGAVSLNVALPPDFATTGTLAGQWNGVVTVPAPGAPPFMPPANTSIQQIGGLSSYQEVEWQFSLATGAAFTGSTIVFEGTVDGVNYFPISARKRPGLVSYTQITNSTGGLGVYAAEVGTAQSVRARMSSWNGTDSISCTMSIGVAISTYRTIGQIVGCTQTLGPAQTTLSFGAATQLDSTKLVNRKTIEVSSLPTNTTTQGQTTTQLYVMVGFANTVSPSNGRMLAPGESWQIDADETVSVWATAQASGQSPVVTTTQIGQ